MPPASGGAAPKAAPDDTLGEKVFVRTIRFTLYKIALYAVLGVTAFLIGLAGIAWWLFSQGEFTPREVAFLEAESTLLIAAAAVLVIVFEIERVLKPKSRSRSRAGRVPKEPLVPRPPSP